jgi:hypothetical protein
MNFKWPIITILFGFLSPICLGQTDTLENYAMEIVKIKSNKTFQFKEGRNVWVRIHNQKGRLHVKRVTILNIGEHNITFKPYDENFEVVTLNESGIMFIGFSSTGRTIIALISNIILIPVYVTASFVFIGMLLKGDIPHGSVNLPLVHFRKNIDFNKTEWGGFFGNKRGDRIWALRILEL